MKKFLSSLFLLEAGTEETIKGQLLYCLLTKSCMTLIFFNIQQAALDDLQRLFGTNPTPNYFFNQNIHTKICELLI